MSEEEHLLKKIPKQAAGGSGSVKFGEAGEVEDLSLFDIFTSYKFYFFALVCAVNIYRIRYFLGLAGYTLIHLHDKGTYLQLLGYSFALSPVFAPVVG